MKNIIGPIAKTLSLSFVICASIAVAQAQMPADFDKYRAGSEYLAYPVPAEGIPQLTASPEGYVPFHMEHYGRHGSRYLINNEDYTNPISHLKKAEENKKLTKRGKLLMKQLRQIRDDAKNRKGELSPLGHRQHRGIANRMTQNFPQLFTDGTHIDAKSTVAIRCILSMANELAEMQRINPNLTVTCDASRTYQNVLAFSDSTAKKLGKKNDNLVKKFTKKHSNHSAFVSKVFNDTAWARKNIKTDKVFEEVFDIAVNIQSHDNLPDLYDLFTEQELFDQWQVNNTWWYLNYGNTSLANHRLPYRQRVLLQNILDSADTAMVSPRKSVNLRFGHESIVLALSILMELNDYDYDTSDFDTLVEKWHNYDVFMMASNIQIVFYRPEKAKKFNPDDVLVKVLLNEKEVKLPVPAVSGPYVKWNDLRSYYIDKLGRFKDFES